MLATSTETRVRKIIAEHLGHFDKGSLTPREFEWTDTLESMGADSLDIIELLMAIEEEFGADVTDEQADEWRTAGDVLKTVEALL